MRREHSEKDIWHKTHLLLSFLSYSFSFSFASCWVLGMETQQWKSIYKKLISVIGNICIMLQKYNNHSGQHIRISVLMIHLEYSFTKVVDFKIKCRIFKLCKFIFSFRHLLIMLSHLHVTHCVGKILVSWIVTLCLHKVRESS